MELEGCCKAISTTKMVAKICDTSVNSFGFRTRRWRELMRGSTKGEILMERVGNRRQETVKMQREDRKE